MEMQLDGFFLAEEIPETPRTLIITTSSQNLLYSCNTDPVYL